MYKDTDQLHLLDQEDYNQYSLPILIVKSNSIF